MLFRPIVGEGLAEGMTFRQRLEQPEEATWAEASWVEGTETARAERPLGARWVFPWCDRCLECINVVA